MEKISLLSLSSATNAIASSKRTSDRGNGLGGKLPAKVRLNRPCGEAHVSGAPCANIPTARRLRATVRCAMSGWKREDRRRRKRKRGFGRRRARNWCEGVARAEGTPSVLPPTSLAGGPPWSDGPDRKDHRHVSGARETCREGCATSPLGQHKETNHAGRSVPFL